MHVQPFGNGTTAIYAALRALGCRGRRVAIPANICPSVISAIYHSSNTPSFVDVERTRWGLDPELLSGQLDGVGAVIAVHMFGIPCFIDRIANICRSRAVPLIEDCAQAEGAAYQGTTVGAFGDVAIFSYGAGKIISVGAGGSASTRDEDVHGRLRSEHARLPGSGDHSAHAELGRAFKELYNTEYPALSLGSRARFDALLREIAPRLLCRHDPALDDAIASQKSRLAANISSRLTKVRLYREFLEDVPRIELMPFPEGSAPWRCNLLLEFGLRQQLLKDMLQQRMNVSSWYPDMSAFVSASSFVSTPPLANSRDLDRRVLNLWVDEATLESDVRGVCAYLSKAVH